MSGAAQLFAMGRCRRVYRHPRPTDQLLRYGRGTRTVHGCFPTSTPMSRWGSTSFHAGSAQVVRYLCRALVGRRWKPTLFTGSVGGLDDSSNACRFFDGIDCEVLDYSPAIADSRRGGDPMAANVPMHASYEDKPGVPDRIFLDLDDDAFRRQVDSWTRFVAARAMGRPDVVHLHHLTPMHAAIRSVWPGVPVITHLHGTELKMMASVRDGTIAAGRHSDAVDRADARVGGRFRPSGSRRGTRRAAGPRAVAGRPDSNGHDRGRCRHRGVLATSLYAGKATGHVEAMAGRRTTRMAARWASRLDSIHAV